MNAHLFSPNALSPTRIADRIFNRYFDEGRLMPGVESTPIPSEIAPSYADSYERAWDENRRDDNQAKDLDHRQGVIHTDDGVWEKFETYSGDNQDGRSTSVTYHHDKDEVFSMDRRELRATAQGWDYVIVQVHSSGNVEANATHIDRYTRQGTEQTWNLRM